VEAGRAANAARVISVMSCLKVVVRRQFNKRSALAGRLQRHDFRGHKI
jgi:hypothetical protein